MPLTTHVLDTSRGGPASGVPLSLCRLEGSTWTELVAGTTDQDGRAGRLVEQLDAATYRIRFQTGTYFAATGTPGFYPYADVVFTIRAPDEHYHVPLLLSPFGYSTYRGS